MCSKRDDLLGHLYWQPGVPTLCGIENDLPPVDAVAELKWRTLQICRDLYNLSNHGTLNQGKTLHSFFIRTLNISNWEEDSTT